MWPVVAVWRMGGFLGLLMGPKRMAEPKRKAR